MAGSPSSDTLVETTPPTTRKYRVVISALGQSLHFDARVMSALTPIATKMVRRGERRYVPIATGAPQQTFIRLVANSTHIHGPQGPVEEPSTASKAEKRSHWRSTSR